MGASVAGLKWCPKGIGTHIEGLVPYQHKESFTRPKLTCTLCHGPESDRHSNHQDRKGTVSFVISQSKSGSDCEVRHCDVHEAMPGRITPNN